MTIRTFAEYLAALEQISSRNDITARLADMFSHTTPPEARIASYLSLGRLVPKFEQIEFQLATKMMVRIIALASKQSEQTVQLLFKETGDLGTTAWKLVSHMDSPVPTDISLTSVYTSLISIAQEQGSGSVERKVQQFAGLLGTLDPLSIKYVVRIPVGSLRLGFSDMTILDSLSWMNAGDKSLRKELELAYNVSADIGYIAEIFRKDGIAGISHCTATAGIPIRPQQSERLGTSQEIINKLGTAAVEYKLDGFRAQVHIVSKKRPSAVPEKLQEQLSLEQSSTSHRVMVFSRSLERTTHMFPEIVSEIQKLSVDSVILDGEAIGYNPKTGRHLPFQETIQRKRKHGIDDISKRIPLRYYAFDILLLNGKSLLDMPFHERRKILESLFSRNTQLNSQTVTIAEQVSITSSDQLIVIFNQSVKYGFEGIMAKKPDAPYQAGARNFTWVKFKHTGEGKLADTLDCVVMGYYAGQGKRSGFGIGAFLVGVRSDRQDDQFLTVAKIGTGLSDDQWVQMRQLCEKNAVKNIPATFVVPKELIPDLWVQPSIIVEIAADEITKTPLHTAGLALRFPRLVRFRSDKSPIEATTVLEVKRLFDMQ